MAESKRFLGQAAAYAMHAKHPSGMQTAAQLAAERANLAKARMARGQFRHTTAATFHSLHKSTVKSRGDAARARLYRMTEIASVKNHVRGSRWLAYHKRATIKKPSISGKFRKFRGSISPGRYGQRTSWGTSTKPRHTQRLRIRSKRFTHVKHWKNHGKRFTPR